MHAQLDTDTGLTLMASDAPSSMGDQPVMNGSISLSGENAPELRGYFEELADGGTVIMPMETAGWGDTFGMCTDKFGTEWLVNIAGKHEHQCLTVCLPIPPFLERVTRRIVHHPNLQQSADLGWREHRTNATCNAASRPQVAKSSSRPSPRSSPKHVFELLTEGVVCVPNPMNRRE